MVIAKLMALFIPMSRLPILMLPTWVNPSGLLAGPVPPVPNRFLAATPFRLAAVLVVTSRPDSLPMAAVIIVGAFDAIAALLVPANALPIRH